MIQTNGDIFETERVTDTFIFRVDKDVSLKTMKGILGCLKMVKRKRRQKKRYVMGFVSVV